MSSTSCAQEGFENQFFVIEKLDYDCEGRYVTKRKILGITYSLEKAIEHCNALYNDLRRYDGENYVSLHTAFFEFVIRKTGFI